MLSNQAFKNGGRFQSIWHQVRVILPAILLYGCCMTAFCDNAIPSFDGGVVSSNSTTGGNGPTMVDPTAYVGKMQGVALGIMMILIVIAGLLVAAGKQGMFLSIVSGVIFLFGAGWIVLTIAHALGRI